MAIPKVGLNITGVQNISTPDFNVNTSSVGAFLDSMVQKANEVTGENLGLISLTTIFSYLFMVLSDTTEFGGFRYSPLRAVGIASGIASVIGIVMLTIGYFTNLPTVATFMGICLVSTLWVFKEER